MLILCVSRQLSNTHKLLSTDCHWMRLTSLCLYSDYRSILGWPQLLSGAHPLFFFSHLLAIDCLTYIRITCLCPKPSYLFLITRTSYYVIPDNCNLCLVPHSIFWRCRFSLVPHPLHCGLSLYQWSWSSETIADYNSLCASWTLLQLGGIRLIHFFLLLFTIVSSWYCGLYILTYLLLCVLLT